MEDFYVTLTSDVKSIYFENKPSNFKTKLPKRVSLSGVWECGLAEIIYPFRWYNVPTAQYFKVTYWVKYRRGFSCYLPPGHYTIEEIVNQLNNSMEHEALPFELPKFEVFTEKLNKKIRIKFSVMKSSNTIIGIGMNDFLCEMLGFKKNLLDEYLDSFYDEYALDSYHLVGKNGITDLNWKARETPNENDLEYVAEDNIDITGGYHTLFVYCDNIKPHLVGDSNVSLLKFIEIPNNKKFGDQIHLRYSNIQYFPIMSNEFEAIEIDIKDDSGKNIPFIHGKSTLVLYFRKK